MLFLETSKETIASEEPQLHPQLQPCVPRGSALLQGRVPGVSRSSAANL